MQRVGSSPFSYAEESKARDGARRFAFHHFLLLPAARVAGNGAGTQSGGTNFGRSASQVRIRPGGLRDYAGTCPFAYRGIRVRGSAAIAIATQRGRCGIAAILAAAVLRLQCVLASEAEGEAGVHARKLGEGETGERSARLALEQLVVL